MCLQLSDKGERVTGYREHRGQKTTPACSLLCRLQRLRTDGVCLKHGVGVCDHFVNLSFTFS